MAVPKFFEFFDVLLKVLSDGQIHKAKDLRTQIALIMNLSEEDRTEMLPSRKQYTFDNRIAWARTYLDRAGLIETPLRGQYRITERGQQAIASGEKIDLDYLERFPEFVQFRTTNGGEQPPKHPNPPPEDTAEKTPTEILQDAFKKITASLSSELMKEVMKLTPSGFEKLVVQLLLQMGYGSGVDNAGFVTKLSGDGGIDGTIKEDQLGFSTIYIQAKQWQLDSVIGRPEIQKFAGALQGEKATRGLFITTARFSDAARQYADNLHGSNIVLVDGNALTRLMIKYNLGVSVEQIYEVKRIDTDFFSDSL